MSNHKTFIKLHSIHTNFSEFCIYPTAKKRLTQIYTEEKALDDAHTAVLHVLKSASEDDFFRDDYYKHAKSIRDLVDIMVNSDVKSFATQLGKKIWQVMRAGKDNIGSTTGEFSSMQRDEADATR